MAQPAANPHSQGVLRNLCKTIKQVLLQIYTHGGGGGGGGGGGLRSLCKTIEHGCGSVAANPPGGGGGLRNLCKTIEQGCGSVAANPHTGGGGLEKPL